MPSSLEMAEAATKRIGSAGSRSTAGSPASSRLKRSTSNASKRSRPPMREGEGNLGESGTRLLPSLLNNGKRRPVKPIAEAYELSSQPNDTRPHRVGLPKAYPGRMIRYRDLAKSLISMVGAQGLEPWTR